MDDLADRLDDALLVVRDPWSAERARVVRQAIDRRRRARSRARRTVAAATTAMMLLALALAVDVRSPGEASPDPVPRVARLPQRSAPGAPRLVRFDDGSTATLLDDRAELHEVLTSPARVVVELRRGAARFDVLRAPARVFRVEAGEVAVEVLGTRFTVARDMESLSVTVEQGLVRVAHGDATSLLRAGDGGGFPLHATPSPTPLTAQPFGPAPALSPEGEPTHVNSRDAEPSPPRTSWRALARRGRYAEARAVMTREGPAAVRDEPGELLLAADVARLSHHDEDALGPLRRLVTRHPSDPRAPLAAFSLGRVLLVSVRRPREAAAAFALVRQLDPTGTFAEDALAREVECWRRAGEPTRARSLAEEYFRSYPAGRRASAVLRYGAPE